MALPALSFEQAPPISVPLRFFLTAPAFGLAAAGLIAWAGPGVFASRYTPGLLAATHLLVLGVLAMCMVGALLQMLPVVAGVTLRHPNRLAGIVHPGLVLGTGLLAGGLYTAKPRLLLAALPLLGGALLLFAGSALWGLARAPAKNATVTAMKAAVAALVVTAALGIALAWGYSGRAALPMLALTDVHLSWGLFGWVGMLIVGVAYQVVPMFQLTPPYPMAATRLLLPLAIAGLLLLSLGSVNPDWWVSSLANVLLAAPFAVFAAATLVLQSRRRRKVPDVTLRFWRVAMVAILAALLLWIIGRLEPAWQATPSHAIALGILWVFGFACSAVNGMLYKIVPFLVWLHLTSMNPPRGSIPNMKQIVADRAANHQALAHEGALALLLAASIRPATFLYPAAAVTALSFLMLGRNLTLAWRLYRRLAMFQAGSGFQPVSR